MNVCEEDRPKNSGKGIGIAVGATAIGVAVGAALYYFLRKPAENPSEGHTNRRREPLQTLANDASPVHENERFRERSWSLEECSICFEVMLNDQQLTTLPCTHNFHAACIRRWLDERETCPNCRKNAA